jgi:two-component system CheB/CheR fusion protein
VGLSLVQRIQLHGGTVTAEREGTGLGSTFVVRMPAREPVATSQAPASSEKEVPRRVLVVEDHDDSREMLRTLLEADGHEVHEAADGLAAVEEALGWRPDVVLLDVGLPALDGFEAARRIRAGGGAMRLVALTGYGQPDDVARSREAGFDEHLVKPIDARRVSEAVRPVPTPAPGLAKAQPRTPTPAAGAESSSR